MTLVVLGKYPIRLLKSMVAGDFGYMPAGSGGRKGDLPRLLKPADLPAVLHVDSGRKDPALILSFPVPPVGQHYQTRPARYLANLIDSRDEGGLSPYLKTKGWAKDLSTGQRIDSPRFATFDIHITLTDAGLRHWQSIIGIVFSYLDQIGQDGITPGLYRRQAIKAIARFKYQSRVMPMAYTARLARSMTVVPTSAARAAPTLMTDYEPGRIKAYLDHLSPDNLLATLSRPHGHFAKRDPRSHASFSLTRIPDRILAQWIKPHKSHDFAVKPGANAYKPGSKNLKPVQYDTKAARKAHSRALL
jgi:secreted Zn-dependent insulinase-like peptidase